MTRVCTLCARGGSKGVPNKNLKLLLGRPLIAHSVEQAVRSGFFELVAVSSDSDEILAAASEAGASILVKRPDEMASDTAPKVPAIKHCLQEVERIRGKTFEVLVDLDATSPLRTRQDLAGAIALLEDRGVSSVITGSPARRSPYFNLVEREESGCVRLSKPLPKQIVRRQDAPQCFDMNASIYVWNRNIFLADPRVLYDDTLLFEMPPERSVDIDSELDFEIVQFLMSKASENGDEER